MADRDRRGLSTASNRAKVRLLQVPVTMPADGFGDVIGLHHIVLNDQDAPAPAFTPNWVIPDQQRDQTSLNCSMAELRWCEHFLISSYEVKE
ncbi:MAG: hypothetical protein ACRC67_14675 [Inquilinus sp.]|uniref:hypothetical protein n=1 Tax=Inquilinus sp. TaxID=1932117 RepID=UPI003F323132